MAGPILPRQRPFLAVYLILCKGDQLLMMKRQNTGYYDGYWALPAGHVDEGEESLSAASRELAEETGLVVAPDCWRLRQAMHRQAEDRIFIDLFLEADLWSGEPANCEPHKCADLAFQPLNALPQPIVPFLQPVLKPLAAGRPGKPGTILLHGWAED